MFEKIHGVEKSMKVGVRFVVHIQAAIICNEADAGGVKLYVFHNTPKSC